MYFIICQLCHVNLINIIIITNIHTDDTTRETGVAGYAGAGVSVQEVRAVAFVLTGYRGTLSDDHLTARPYGSNSVEININVR